MGLPPLGAQQPMGQVSVGLSLEAQANQPPPSEQVQAEYTGKQELQSPLPKPEHSGYEVTGMPVDHTSGDSAIDGQSVTIPGNESVQQSMQPGIKGVSIKDEVVLPEPEINLPSMDTTPDGHRSTEPGVESTQSIAKQSVIPKSGNPTSQAVTSHSANSDTAINDPAPVQHTRQAQLDLPGPAVVEQPVHAEVGTLQQVDSDTGRQQPAETVQVAAQQTEDRPKGIPGIVENSPLAGLNLEPRYPVQPRPQTPDGQETPQVRIGQINVLIEDQAAPTSNRRGTPAQPSANPFGLRGL